MSGAHSQSTGSCIDPDAAAAYVAGGLTSGEASRVDEHIDRCAECRALIAAAVRSTSQDGLASGKFGRAGDTVTLPAGMRVGRYVVEGPLGVGAMGVVVRALDPELDRQVALKRVRVDVPEVEAWQERLRREARAMAQLSHPNVVTVYDLVIHERRLFIAMELIDGVSLKAWLGEERRAWRELLEAFQQAGRGLAAAHGVGLVHRDFKPENVLRSRAGRVWVTDFGLARVDAEAEGPVCNARFASGGRSSTKGLVGTPAYMAPEQFRGEPADARSDQFSFCVALYEALYGERPTGQGGSPTSALRERSPVPTWVLKVLLRGMSASPGDRYPSMQVLLAELGRDRRVRWLRAAVAAGLVASAACMLLAYQHGRAASAVAACQGARARLAGVWDGARAQTVRDALLATHKPYALDAWRGVQQTLDGYADAWAAMHADACEATQIRGEQSQEAMDLRMACLGERRKDMSTAVDVLSHADEAVVSHALVLAEALTPVSVCADVASLRHRAKFLTDRARATRVEELQGDLRQAKVLALAGKLREALPIAKSASVAADSIGYVPLQAEASYRLGGLWAMTGELVQGQGELLRATRFADAASDDRTRAEVCRLLLYYAGRQGKADLIPILREEAMAALERQGGDAQAEARLLVSLAGAQAELGQYAEARPTAERALALAEKAFGPDARSVSDALVNLGIAEAKLGALDNATRDFARALDIYVARLGADHPDVAVAESDVAEVMLLRLDLKGAEQHYRRAIEVAEANLGKDHFRVGRYVQGLGEVFVVARRYAEAEILEQRAVEITEKSLGPDHARLVDPLSALGEARLGRGKVRDAVALLERAMKLPPYDAFSTSRTKYALARALSVTHGDVRRARRLAVEARDAFERLPPSPRVAGLLGEVNTWLDAHPVDP